MFCHHCGHKLTEGSKFCNNCGKDVAELPRDKAEENSHLEVKEKSPDKNKNKNSSVAAIITTVIIAGGVLIWIMSSVGSYAPSGSLSKESAASSSSLVTTTPANQQGAVSPGTASVTSAPKALPDIVAEWGKSTAYVDCYWMRAVYSAYPAGGNPMGNYEQTYLRKSGSGLLALFNSTPTIITNKHVVNDSQYGLATECDVGFHNDNGAYYSISSVNQPAQSFTYSPELAPLIMPEIPRHGQILFGSGGNDVAYLSQMQKEGAPSITLNRRAAGDRFTCGTIPIGESLVILGYPDYGSGAGTITSVLSNLQITATEGIISGQDGIYYTTSAKIDPGNSGGLAIDEKNNCYIGIPTAAVVGEIESLGRILPAPLFLRY